MGEAAKRVVFTETPPPDQCAVEYDRLRERLKVLWLEPVKNMPAIAHVMRQLDDTHAAFKAQHKTDDHQRY